MFVDVFKRYYGPTMKAFDAAEKDGREDDLQKELEVLFECQNRSPSKQAVSIPAIFLRVTACLQVACAMVLGKPGPGLAFCKLVCAPRCESRRLRSSHALHVSVRTVGKVGVCHGSTSTSFSQTVKKVRSSACVLIAFSRLARLAHSRSSILASL